MAPKSKTQEILEAQAKRNKVSRAKRDASLEEKKAKEAVTKQKKKDLIKSMGSLASRNAARAMASDEGNTGGQGQTAIPASAESRKRLGTLSINALTAIPIGQVVGGVARIGKGVWKVGEKIYNSAQAAKTARAAQVAQAAKAVKPPTATPRVVNSKVKPISKNDGFASNATRKTPVVAKPKTPPRKVAPSKLSKVGEAREARRNPVNKNQDLASIRSTPKPQKDTVQAGSRLVKRKTTQPVGASKAASKPKVPAIRKTTQPVGASKAASKPKVPAIRKTTQPTVRNSKDKASTLKDKSFTNPLLPLAIAAGVTGVGLNSLPSKAPKTPKPSKSQYDSTMGSSAGSDGSSVNKPQASRPRPKNKPNKVKSRPASVNNKKEDPDYKLYSGDFAKKYDLKYMTGEAMERDEEKRFMDGAKSGGHLKKLKNSRKVTKKSKGGFMGKGAGCTKRGF